MRITELQQQYDQAATEVRTLHARLTQTAESEGRQLGAGEKRAMDAAMQEAEGLKRRLLRAQGDASMSATISQMTAGMGLSPDGSSAPLGRSGRSLGAQFVSSGTYEWLRKNPIPGDRDWHSTSSELQLMATTLDESGGSGGALVLPHYLPGILPSPTRPLVVADLIAPGTTDSNLISYMKEITFTNAAAGVLEAGTKPESAMVFAAATEAVKKIAHWVPVTEELLEDQAGMKSYIDTRLQLGVQLTEDDELLNGSGVAPHLNGFLVRAGLATAVARGTDTNADAILRQIAAIFTATGLKPDGIILNPSNWLSIQMLKAADGTYISGGTPMSAPPSPSLWGIPVALTSAIVVNTALVGCFQTAAQLFRRGGLRVEASNSHANFFIENKIAIRAEERLALVAYRESAFGKVTGLN